MREINREQNPIFQPNNNQGYQPIYRKNGASRIANRRLLILFALIMLPILAACTRNIGDESDGWNPPVSVGGVVYVGTKDGQVVSLTEDESGNLKENWTFPGTTGQQDLIGVYKTPVVVGDLVYVNGIDGFLYALDKESGNLTGDGWRRPDNPFVEPEPLVAGPAYDSSNDIILSPSEDGKLYAYTAKNSFPFLAVYA